MILLLGVVVCAVALLGWWLSSRVHFRSLTCGDENEHAGAEIIALPPRILCDPGWPAYAELQRIARRDGVSVGEAAAFLLQECLVEDEDSGRGGAA